MIFLGAGIYLQRQAYHRYSRNIAPMRSICYKNSWAKTAILGTMHSQITNEYGKIGLNVSVVHVSLPNLIIGLAVPIVRSTIENA